MIKVELLKLLKSAEEDCETFMSIASDENEV